MNSPYDMPDDMTIQKKNKRRTTQFIVGSFVTLIVISIISFFCLGSYITKQTNDSIDKVGRLYMTGMDEQISAHFRTLINLKLEQLDAVVAVVSNDASDTGALYDELVYRSNVRNFNYLALCAEDGRLEMLDGEQLTLTDPEPFFESLRNSEKKVAVGTDASGDQVVLLGTQANYLMKNGETSIALVAAVPIDYISTMLSTEEDNSLIYTHIIRQDGSFIMSNISDKYPDYFTSLYERYSESDRAEIDKYIAELSAAMDSGENYSRILELDASRQQIYCTSMPYSEWHLVTMLPFGPLNETVEDLNTYRTNAMLLVFSIIFLVLLGIFFNYFRINRQQLHDLEVAREAALKATEAKTLFLSNMSHDIRTPMNAIVGMTAIAAAHIDDKEQVQNCLKKITLSGKHLLGLINDVLDMSKIESGKMTLTAERISLREVVEGIVGIVQTQIKSKQQNFNVHIDNILAENVYCDSVRLNQVMLNLLSNAVKYTPEGGTIQLDISQEESPRELGNGYIRTNITVTDNGIGMTPEFLEHVFDSYTREDSQRVRKVEGAGLGMAITKHIVDAMHGTISVESELNRGTKFYVALDMEKAEDPEIDMILPPWKMLVVDDDEIFCNSAVELLKSIGITADATLSGEDAIKLVEKHHHTGDDYQIILLDWKLPGMDGLAVAKQIRQIVSNNMPIILISAYDWSDLEEEAHEAGIDGFIAKPLFKSTLFHGLKKYANAPTQEPEPETTDADDALTGRRILVAEDNDLNWEILEELLSDLGINTEWAENGQICVDKFTTAAPGYYDAILMDVRMPVMNGYEATQAIRASAHPSAESIPIIAMTADAFSEDIQRCLESGMNAHTAKPINLAEIISLLKKYILNKEE